MNHLRISAGLVCVSAWIVACGSVPTASDYPMQVKLVGQTRQAVFACAGTPLRERFQESLTILRYYREAPLLEESFSVAKGSSARAHHGCWADVLVKDDRVAEVRYVSVPATIDSSDRCEEIFEHCAF